MTSHDRPTLWLRRLSTAIVGLSLVAAAGAAAEPDPARCSLSWSELSRNFAPGTGWVLAAPPVAFSVREGRVPEYQAHMLESRAEQRTALIIAEWGNPRSPELGPVVYCAVRDAQGGAVEELGTNPLEAKTPTGPCELCA
jgi:hypothetical protein